MPRLRSACASLSAGRLLPGGFTMRRLIPTAVIVLLAAACSNGHGAATARPSSRDSASPGVTRTAAPNPAGLTEDSTCADYLRASQKDQSAFLNHEVQVHSPQTGNPSVTLPSGSSFKGGTYNGDQIATTEMAGFIALALSHDCPAKKTARLGDAAAWAWKSSPSPS